MTGNYRVAIYTLNSVVKFECLLSYDDCGDRADEKGCRASDFGYSVKLAGSAQSHEGRVEVTGQDLGIMKD